MKRALVLALLLTSCQSGKLSEAWKATALATTWIGIAADGLTWYRLDLDDEGNGTGAVTSNAETAAYRLRWWEERGRVTIHMEIVDGAPGAARRLDMEGPSKTWELALTVEGLHSLVLWRESDLFAARKRLVERMGHPATTANPP